MCVPLHHSNFQNLKGSVSFWLQYNYSPISGTCTCKILAVERPIKFRRSFYYSINYLIIAFQFCYTIGQMLEYYLQMESGKPLSPEEQDHAGLRVDATGRTSPPGRTAGSNNNRRGTRPSSRNSALSEAAKKQRAKSAQPLLVVKSMGKPVKSNNQNTMVGSKATGSSGSRRSAGLAQRSNSNQRSYNAAQHSYNGINNSNNGVTSIVHSPNTATTRSRSNTAQGPQKPINYRMSAKSNPGGSVSNSVGKSLSEEERQQLVREQSPDKHIFLQIHRPLLLGRRPCIDPETTSYITGTEYYQYSKLDSRLRANNSSVWSQLNHAGSYTGTVDKPIGIPHGSHTYSNVGQTHASNSSSYRKQGVPPFKKHLMVPDCVMVSPRGKNNIYPVYRGRVP